MNLKVWLGLGSISQLPHICEDEDVTGVVARSFPIWSLGAPCVRTEDRLGLLTVASSPTVGSPATPEGSKVGR